jgi:hypothetical protein
MKLYNGKVSMRSVNLQSDNNKGELHMKAHARFCAYLAKCLSVRRKREAKWNAHVMPNTRSHSLMGFVIT